MIIRKNSNLAKILGVIKQKVTQEDYDEVLIITGDEGVGKSNLGLIILEWWKKEVIGKISVNDVKEAVGMDAADFSVLLQQAKKHDIVINDEAADISSRGAMNKTNKLFMVVYQLIRGENLFTILIIPSIFDLDTFFRKRRIRHLFHVPRRGVYHFWDKQALRRMVEVNEGKPFKNYYRVPPTARGGFKKYEGVYSEPYMNKKKEKMFKVREMLAAELNNPSELISASEKKKELQNDHYDRVKEAVAGVLGVVDE